MLGKIFDKMLHEDESQIKAGGVSKNVKRLPLFEKRDWIFAGIVFLIAISARLFVLFKFSDPLSPGWYDDTFHHWQVAYLSKEVGFSHGFLRLWDFKGMEYFWGLLHPLVLVILFWITGSVSIMVPRLLTVVAGSIVISFIFLLVKRYFNLFSAWASALFAVFMPVVLFSDTVGMQEPLAIVLILGALLLWPRKVGVVGILFALAGMVRAEYWLFGVGLFTMALFAKQQVKGKAILVIGWLVPTLLYIKYLLDNTGNAIYPIYWNFLASVKGEWFLNVPLPPGAIEAQTIARVFFALSLLSSIYLIIKRPKYYLFFLFGFGNILFLGFMLGFGAYIRGYVPRFWIDRLFAWPYAFTGILVSILLLYYIPSKVKHRVIPQTFGGLAILVIILLSQFIWIPISKWAGEADARYEGEKKLADEVGGYYQNGKILIPEDRPVFVYYLVNNHDINGKYLLGQMYDPFFYIEEDPFQNWNEYRQDVLDWIKKDDIKLIVFASDRERYMKLVELEPQLFNLKQITDYRFYIYEVTEQ